jgi:iron-sulfur cluster repair protein YtfE (RIC family)
MALAPEHPVSAQLDLPAQAHVAEGPIDHTGMYLMHFAFRRDLEDLLSAAELTPVEDAATWTALGRYWSLFAGLLHHHHVVEDDHYWPALVAAASVRGTPEDQATVTAMEDEHAEIDPAVDACRVSFDQMARQPGRDSACNLYDRLARLRDLVSDHMAHEERETLPLVQRVMDPADYAVVEKAIGRAYPLRLVFQLLPWATHDLPDADLRQALRLGGPPERLLLRLGRGRYERLHAAAFRHVGTR